MSRCRNVVFFGLFISCGSAADAQGTPYSPATLQLSGSDMRGSTVPARSSATLLSFTLEADTTGGNVFDAVTTDPTVSVSVVLPSNIEVTNANASSFGYTFTIVPSGTLPAIEIPSVFSLPGTHTVIQVPPGQASGVYNIKANASAASTDSAILATYFSSSSVGVATVTNSSNYKVGDTVVLSSLVFDGAAPVSGANITAAITAPVSLAGQTSLGNYQLVSQSAINANLTDYSYSATLANTGGAVRQVFAQLSGVPPDGVTILNENLVFGDVSANSSAASQNTITIERDPNQPFDPSTLQWDVLAGGVPVNVALMDSGLYDASPGDGIYTGTFTPTSPGKHTAFLSVTGTSLAGNAFSRISATQFTVTQQALASFQGFTDSQEAGGVRVNATVNVVTGGTYIFTVQLQAGSQTIQQWGSANLSTGPQQISALFPNDQLLTLGANGPYERVNAVLTTMVANDALIADASADAGPTAAYSVNSFQSSSVYFTGQYSSTPIDANGIPGFEILNISVGISQQSTGYCEVDGGLYAGTTLIDSTSFTQYFASATNSITLSFNGYRIRASGLDGPYTLRNVTVNCGGAKASGTNLFQTPAYTASQFESGMADFALSGTGPVTDASGPVITATSVPVNITRMAGFSQSIQFSVTGLPAGATANLYFATVQSANQMNVVITTAGTPPGSYPLTVTGVSGSLTHSITTTFIESPAAGAPTFSPAAGTYSSVQTVALNSTSPNPLIYYTTDGTTPTYASQLFQPGFSEPITGSSTTTIKAFTYASGFSRSAVVSATYTIQPIVPTVVSYNVLWGSLSYNVIGTSRNRLPWQITGIQIVFSEVITTGNVNSLSGAGVTTTGFSGLGTNTLTWTVSPLALGNFPTALAGAGPNALQDAGGNALGGGAGFSQNLKILYADFNDDGVVNSQDLVLVNAVRNGAYNVLADMDGNGVVDAADLQIVRTQQGTSLP
jgi:hypothetical protein